MSKLKIQVGEWYRTRYGNLIKCVADVRQYSSKRPSHPLVLMGVDCDGAFYTEFYSTSGKDASFNELQEIVEHVPECCDFAGKKTRCDTPRVDNGYRGPKVPKPTTLPKPPPKGGA